MPLSDIFTTPFLICLGISLLLIGLLGMYFTQKFSEQNHKISSMLELVSTMAQEINFIRSNILDSPEYRPQFGSAAHSAIVNQNNVKNVNNFEENLIPVSDDSDTESESDCDNESDSDSDGDGDSDDESEQHSKIKSISLEPSNVNINDVVQTLEILEENESDDDDDDSEDDDASVETYEHENNSAKETETSSHDNLEVFSNINFEKLTNEEEDESNVQVKKLEFNTLDEPKAVDYKKLSLAKLREIALEKGGVDASKMKKADLLNLLLSA
jgi:hypothetical protein